MSSIEPPPGAPGPNPKKLPEVSALTQASAPERKPRPVPFVWILALSGVSLITMLIYWMTSSSATTYTGSKISDSVTQAVRSSVPTSQQYAASVDGRYAQAQTPAPPSPHPKAKANSLRSSVTMIGNLSNGEPTDESIMNSHVTPPWAGEGSDAQSSPAPAHVAVVYDASQSGRPYLVATNGGGAASYAIPPIGGPTPPGAAAPTAAPQQAAALDGGDVMVMPDIESTPGAVTIPAGTHIPAVLDDSVDSDLQGPVRAHVLDNICDPRTGAVGIPRGAWLLGEEGGTVISGTRHLGIHWTRLTNPDLSSRLLVNAATLDAEGHSGIAGRPSITSWTIFRDTLVQSIAGAAGQIATVGVSRAVNGAPVYINGTAVAAPPPGSERVQKFTVDANTPFLLYLNMDFDRAGPYHGRYCGRQ
ncbi:MAG: TrbI/VirB10 family protein [Candidatus Baltobacteraceae bacterium]